MPLEHFPILRKLSSFFSYPTTTCDRWKWCAGFKTRQTALRLTVHVAGPCTHTENNTHTREPLVTASIVFKSTKHFSDNLKVHDSTLSRAVNVSNTVNYLNLSSKSTSCKYRYNWRLLHSDFRSLHNSDCHLRTSLSASRLAKDPLLNPAKS